MEKRLPVALAMAQKHGGGGGERVCARPWRWAKTVFFLVAMLASLLLVCAPPLLVVILDLALPSALLSAHLRAGEDPMEEYGSFVTAVVAQARAFDFRSSLVDLLAVSSARALLILGAYMACGGGAAYLWVVAASAAGSVSYVLAKARRRSPAPGRGAGEGAGGGGAGAHAPAVAGARGRTPRRRVQDQLPRAPPPARVPDRRRGGEVKRGSSNTQRAETV